jgi:hypothetical protein
VIRTCAMVQYLYGAFASFPYGGHNGMETNDESPKGLERIFYSIVRIDIWIVVFYC